MLFVGQYSHTIDQKGRAIVPSKLREKLGDSFWVTKGMDGCLFVYDNAEWEKFEEKLGDLPMTTPAGRNFVRFFLSGADNPEIDKQGRILIPQHLRDHAGLKKDILFVGAGRRVEIWDREKWEANDTGDMDEIAAKLEELGLRI